MILVHSCQGFDVFFFFFGCVVDGRCGVGFTFVSFCCFVEELDDFSFGMNFFFFGYWNKRFYDNVFPVQALLIMW